MRQQIREAFRRTAFRTDIDENELEKRIEKYVNYFMRFTPDGYLRYRDEAEKQAANVLFKAQGMLFSLDEHIRNSMPDEVMVAIVGMNGWAEPDEIWRQDLSKKMLEATKGLEPLTKFFEELRPGCEAAYPPVKGAPQKRPRQGGWCARCSCLRRAYRKRSNYGLRW